MLAAVAYKGQPSAPGPGRRLAGCALTAADGPDRVALPSSPCSLRSLIATLRRNDDVQVHGLIGEKMIIGS